MAYLTKEQYFRRELAAHKRNTENAVVAADHGMTEEQQDAVIDLCSMRHKYHCDIDRVAHSDADSRYLSKIVELNARLHDLGLPTIKGVPTDNSDYIDIYTLDERLEEGVRDEYDYPGLDDIDAHDRWVDDQLNEIKSELYLIHDAMEHCLAEIDKRYGTHFAPTGTLRNLDII